MADELKDLLETMRRENAAAHEGTRRHTEAVAEETRRYFDVVAEDIRRDVRTVAESVVTNTERIDAFRAETRREFADVRSMIKFSHADLDRRLSTLEETVSDLKARVDRIEESTH